MSWIHEFGTQYVPPSWVADYGGQDESWGNDQSASFFFGQPLEADAERCHELFVVLWVDAADDELRVYPGAPRYTVVWPSPTGELQTDSSSDARAAVEAALEWMDMEREERAAREEAALLAYKY